jgi:hypothetical protein
LSFLPLVEPAPTPDDGVMMLIVAAVLLLLAWAAISFGPEDGWRRRC